jgi:phosphoribosylformylglycinamidine cyclo-ligase
MVLIAAKAEADAVVAALAAAGERPAVIGEIVPASGARSEAKGKGEAWAVQYAGSLHYDA